MQNTTRLASVSLVIALCGSIGLLSAGCDESGAADGSGTSPTSSTAAAGVAPYGTSDATTGRTRLAGDPPGRFAVEHRLAGAPDNLLCPAEGVFTGGIADDAALDAIASLGVKTVISVDAGTPRVEALSARGLRSVHIPLSYGRMDARSQMMLAKALRELDGPFYIHCHHGKHRGPAAAAVALRQLGRMDADEAHEYLVAAKTSEAYEGLWRTVAEAEVMDGESLDALISDFPQIAPVPNFPRVMAESEDIKDRLTLIQDAGWEGPAHHPDLVPAAEAGRMADLFDALSEREAEALSKGESVLEPEFLESLRRTANHARALENLLVPGAPDIDAADRAYELLIGECRSCHQKHRG